MSRSVVISTSTQHHLCGGDFAYVVVLVRWNTTIVGRRHSKRAEPGLGLTMTMTQSKAAEANPYATTTQTKVQLRRHFVIDPVGRRILP